MENANWNAVATILVAMLFFARLSDGDFNLGYSQPAEQCSEQRFGKKRMVQCFLWGTTGRSSRSSALLPLLATLQFIDAP